MARFIPKQKTDAAAWHPNSMPSDAETFFAQHGMTYDELVAVRKVYLEKGINFMSALRLQVSGAKSRGIGWHLTTKEWLEFWGDDLARRGKSSDSLCMCRKQDTGPYRVGNIFKGTPKENSQDYVRGKKARAQFVVSGGVRYRIQPKQGLR